MSVELKDRKTLVQEWIQRFLAYTDQVTWFGANSVMRAWATATAILVEGAYQLYVALLRRYTVLNASGEELAVVAAERGATRLDATWARALVIFQPETANVWSITIGGGSLGGDLLEVDDSSWVQAGDSIRVRNEDGSVSDLRTVIAVTPGTGPSAGDELDVATLTGVYSPATEDVDVLARVLVAVGTALTSTAGVGFETLEAVTTGDANPVLDGEGTALGLADKVWCEAATAGAAGNVDAWSITEFTAGPVRGIASLYNPEAGVGGDDEESDYALKYRTIHGPVDASQETVTWLESMAQRADSNVLRLVRTTSTTVATMTALVLHRNGGTFSTTDLAAIETWIAARTRSYMGVDLDNVTLTSVEVEARITLEPGYTLEDVWRAAASDIVAFLDYRKWEWGEDVDEADLLSIVNGTPGVASLETSSFLPAADVPVGVYSLPTLVRLSLEDIDTGEVINAELAVSF